MGALYLTLTKSYTAEKPNASNIFLDVKDFRMTDDFLTIDHRVLTRDCMIVELTTTIARRYIVDIQAFVNAKDLHNYLGLYTDIYTPVWNGRWTMTNSGSILTPMWSTWKKSRES